eukprot:c34341_g1_i1 orf=289-624(-)
MVLELILIGGVIYYYVKKNKQNKLKKAAFLAGEPFYHKNGAVTYPPNYPGLPPYTPTESAMNNQKRQIPIQDYENVPREQPYSDAVPVSYQQASEKTPLVIETREVVNEKK